jgi:hypothetical protein
MLSANHCPLALFLLISNLELGHHTRTTQRCAFTVRRPPQIVLHDWNFGLCVDLSRWPKGISPQASRLPQTWSEGALMQHVDAVKLVEFIEASKSKGASDEFLASFLTRRGWPEDDVYAALGGYWERVTGFSLPERTSSGESSRDAFLYLLSFSTLATWSSALGSMLFRFIERWFPIRSPGIMSIICGARLHGRWRVSQSPFLSFCW